MLFSVCFFPVCFPPVCIPPVTTSTHHPMEALLSSILLTFLQLGSSFCTASDRFLVSAATKSYWDARAKQVVMGISEEHCIISCYKNEVLQPHVRGHKWILTTEGFKNPEWQALAHSTRTCLMAHTVDLVQVLRLSGKNRAWEIEPVYVTKQEVRKSSEMTSVKLNPNFSPFAETT